MDEQQITIYEAVGGHRFFEELVDRFYAGVADDPILLPLYPEQEDLTGAKERLTLFLCQYWGGPTTYSDTRGHPRLRMRHHPFTIGTAERDAWLAHMTVAVDEAEDLHPEVAARFHQYFAMAADHLINAPG
ncbi:MAG: globin [Actinomycetota bacterium]